MKEDSQSNFKRLRTKIRRLHEVCQEIKELKETQDPCETFFRDGLKSAEKSADRLNKDLATAGKEIDDILGDCRVFGPELVTSIVKFREKTRETRTLQRGSQDLRDCPRKKAWAWRHQR